MPEKRIMISEKVFELFPDFKRGIVIVKDMENKIKNPPIAELLEKVIKSRQEEPTNLTEHEYIKAWDEVHRKFGSNPNRYPPSIKALIKRIQKGGRIPFINSVVALFNYISIEYLIPCGGDDVDTIKGDLCLGIATGKEHFFPLGGKAEETPVPGEVIYYDTESLNVMCRRWNWRNGDFSKITEHTKRAVINIDGIGIIPEDVIIKARNHLAQLLEKYCNAKVETHLLNSKNPSLTISF